MWRLEHGDLRGVEDLLSRGLDRRRAEKGDRPVPGEQHHAVVDPLEQLAVLGRSDTSSCASPSSQRRRPGPNLLHPDAPLSQLKARVPAGEAPAGGARREPESLRVGTWPSVVASPGAIRVGVEHGELERADVPLPQVGQHHPLAWIHAAGTPPPSISA